jgi:hypothetical protein
MQEVWKEVSATFDIIEKQVEGSEQFEFQECFGLKRNEAHELLENTFHRKGFIQKESYMK